MSPYQSPGISILMPVRDAATTLPACLDSIRKQDYLDYELVVIDDHSSDDSRAIINQHAQSDSRIKMYRNPGLGLVAALNHGLAECRAELVARMDADDLMTPERLSKQVHHLQADASLALSASRVRLFPADQITDGFREYIRWQDQCISAQQIANNIFVESPFAHPSVSFRLSKVLSLGGYREGEFPEDYDLWLRMHNAGHRMEKLPDQLLDWRDDAKRTSRSNPRYSREAFDGLRAEYLFRDPRIQQNRDNLAIWGAGRKTRRRCDRLLSQGIHPRAWIDIDPRKIGNRINGVPVVDSRWITDQVDRPFVLVYVTNHGARDLIARELEQMGYKPGEHYLAVG